MMMIGSGIPSNQSRIYGIPNPLRALSCPVEFWKRRESFKPDAKKMKAKT
jgi:hypothetical protein